MQNDPDTSATEIALDDLDADASAPIFRTEPDQELHEKNADFLANRFPSCRNLPIYIPQTTLKFLENGEPTVMLGNDSLYGDEGAYTFTKRQYDNYWKNPSRVSMPPPTGKGLDDYSYDFFQNLLKEFRDESITIYQLPQNRYSDHVKVFGIGLAQHLDQLLDDTHCHTMLLIEPNLEFIYHSTFIFDWVAFFKKAEKRGCSVLIVSSTDTSMIVHVVRDLLINHNVMTFDGTLIYQHFPNQFFTATETKLKTELVNYLSALGYTEDEFYMVGNSYINFMKRDVTKIFRPNFNKKIDIPAIIVGGGPSKDPYYDVLRENKDKAVIVACGSALESLLQEGIVPDIYVLLERSPIVYDSLKKTAEKWDLSNIILIGSTTIDPRIQDHFNTSLFFYRAALSPYQMFGKVNKFFLEGPDPHVGNAAFSFILLSGFRNIYLFGLDLGSREADVHHSKNSLPMQKGTKHSGYNLDIKTQGSFGGTIYTCKQFLLVRTNIEQMAAKYNKKGTIYNCSDGIKIQHTTPKVPRKLNLPVPNIPKTEVLDGIVSGFWPQPRENFEKMWEEYDIRAQVNQFRNEVITLFESSDNIIEDNVLTELHKFFMKSINKAQSSPAIMIRGNIHMMMIGAWYYLLRVKPSDQAKLTAAITKALTLAMDKMVSDTLNLVDDLEDWDPVKADTIERLMT